MARPLKNKLFLLQDFTSFLGLSCDSCVNYGGVYAVVTKTFSYNHFEYKPTYLVVILRSATFTFFNGRPDRQA